MDSFKKREESFERKFSHDKEIEFKVQCRASKTMALWAAERLNLMDIDAQNYIQDVLNLSTEKNGVVAVKEKIRNDLFMQRIDMSSYELELIFSEKISQAHLEIAAPVN